MELQAELVHAETGRRVVRVTASREGHCLGSALGEASSAEEAEDRARQRLLERLAATTSSSFRVQAPISRLKSATPPAASSPSSAGSSPPAPGQAGAPAAAEAPPQAAASPPPAAASPQTAAAPAGMPATAAAASANPGPEEPPPDPDDWSSELLGIDRQLQRLGWQRDQEAIYLQRAFGHPSRSRLTSYGDLLAYLRALESLADASDPAAATVPLRRQDLLAQCDDLLSRLSWQPEQGRRFLEQQLGAASRSQLNDQQLLQFNMLLEGELLTAQR